MIAFNCQNCGAGLPAHTAISSIVRCEFCGTIFNVSKSPAAESDMGDLLLGADFGNKSMPGWEVINEELLSFHPGHPSELRGTYKAQVNTYYVLKSSGFLDDFDASVNIKFTAGNRQMIRAGFYPRFTPEEGGYGVFISAQATYLVGYYIKGNKTALNWQTLMPWTSHAALKPGLNEINRLRVICNGEKFRVYLNGVLATSFQDSRYKSGKLFLAAEPTRNSDLGITFSDLQVREVFR